MRIEARMLKITVLVLTLVLFLGLMMTRVEATQPSLLLITTNTLQDTSLYHVDRFKSGVSGYGSTTELGINIASTYSIDQLRQFDVIATSNDPQWSSYYSELVGKIGTLVSEGKGLIVLGTWHHGGGFADPGPADAWVSETFFTTSIDSVEYEIVSSNLTQGVTTIKGSSVQTFLNGGYPLVRSPNAGGYPDPQASIAVYGYHGLGRYAVISEDFYQVNAQYAARLTGDVGILFSNIMYWVTNMPFPPPPSVIDMDSRIAEMNNTLNMLNTQLLQLNDSLSQLGPQIPQFDSLQNQINQISGSLSQINNSISQVQGIPAQIDDLSNQIDQLKNQQQNYSVYLAVAALILAGISLLVAFVRKKPKA